MNLLLSECMVQMEASFPRDVYVTHCWYDGAKTICESNCWMIFIMNLFFFFFFLQIFLFLKYSNGILARSAGNKYFSAALILTVYSPSVALFPASSDQTLFSKTLVCFGWWLALPKAFWGRQQFFFLSFAEVSFYQRSHQRTETHANWEAEGPSELWVSFCFHFDDFFLDQTL